MMQLQASTLPSASPGVTSLRAAISVSKAPPHRCALVFVFLSFLHHLSRLLAPGSQGRRVRCISRAEADGPAGAISGGTSNPMDFDELSEIIR